MDARMAIDGVVPGLCVRQGREKWRRGKQLEIRKNMRDRIYKKWRRAHECRIDQRNFHGEDLVQALQELTTEMREEREDIEREEREDIEPYEERVAPLPEENNECDKAWKEACAAGAEVRRLGNELYLKKDLKRRRTDSSVEPTEKADSGPDDSDEDEADFLYEGAGFSQTT